MCRHYLNIGDMSSGLPLLFHPVYLLASGTLPERGLLGVGAYIIGNHNGGIRKHMVPC